MSEKLTRQQQRAVEIVSKLGPIGSAEVAKMLGCGQNRGVMHLAKAAKTGAISLTQKGQYALWYAPQDEDKAWSIVRARLEAAKERKRERMRQQCSDWTVKRLKIERAHEDWASATPVHRRIPASEAPPIKITGPVSVFALGAA